MAQEVRTRKMTTRAGNKHKNEEPLKIVRDQKSLQTSQIPEIVQKMTEFGQKTIVTPDAQQPRPGCKTPPVQERLNASKVDKTGRDTDIASGPTAPSSDGNKTETSPLEQAMRIGQQLYGFNHCRIREESKVFQYDMRSLDKLGIERDRVVPSHYIKHSEVVLPERQTTYEKNWSYYTPLYEITEEMKQKLAEANVNIKLEDAQVVIDCWEKVSIDQQKQGKKFLRDRFRELHSHATRQSMRLHPYDLAQRVSDETSDQLWEVWTTMREARKHRSFIRMFWVYQDEVGADNYKTFQRPKIDVKPHNTRKKCKPDEKIRAYGNKFLERDNAVTFCETLQPAFEKLACQIDAYKIEDMQFDLMIGKATQVDDAFRKSLVVPAERDADLERRTQHERGQAAVVKQAVQEFVDKSDRLLRFRVVHENQIEHKRYFHDGLKRPFLPPKPKKPIDMKRNDSLQPPNMRHAQSTIVPNNKDDALMKSEKPELKKNNPKGRRPGRNNHAVDPAPKTNTDTEDAKNRTELTQIPEDDAATKTHASHVASEQVDVNDQQIDEDVKNQVQRAIIENKKKRAIKYRKSQRTSMDFIRLASMALYKQQKELKLKCSGDLYSTQVLDKMNQPDWQIQRNVLLMHHGYSVDKEDQRSITLKKAYRKIEQDNLLQRISARGSQFDHNIVEKAPEKQDERKPVTELGQLRANCVKSKRELQAVEDQYDSLKKRRMVARRGRCHQVFYKPMMKTIFDYESDDQYGMDNFNDTKAGRQEQIEYLLYKGSERAADGPSGEDKQRKARATRKKEKFFKPVDRHLAEMRDTVEDMERRCLKRTKKHLYKMDVMYRPQVKNSALLGQPDPVLNQHFKRKHAFNFQELMGYEADKALFRAGCLPENVHEFDGTDMQKLEDYHDVLVSRQQHQKRQRTGIDEPVNLFKQDSGFYGQKDEPMSPMASSHPTANTLQMTPPFKTQNGQPQGLQTSERQNLLGNLAFLKNGGSRKANAQNIRPDADDKANVHYDESLRPTGPTKYQVNESQHDLKLRYLKDFTTFQQEIERRQRQRNRARFNEGYPGAQMPIRESTRQSSVQEAS